MLFRQVMNEDLGCASYLVGDIDAGVAAVIDPQWDIDPYLRLSRLHGVRIEHVLETHNHADHVSGHGRLARATGATIHIHELADAEYPHEGIADGWSWRSAGSRSRPSTRPDTGPSTPPTCSATGDAASEAWAVVTGDRLFVGDVARPDLAVEAREGAAEGIHRSLQERLLALSDDVEVWPGHLGGSACGGASIDHKSSSTIGYEREHNRRSRSRTRERSSIGAVASIGEQAAERRAHRRPSTRAR